MVALIIVYLMLLGALRGGALAVGAAVVQSLQQTRHCKEH